MIKKNKTIIITGIRGVPAEHGGFETFAEKLALYLISQKWTVYVFCQKIGNESFATSTWNGIKCINVQTKNSGSLSTILFDLKSIIYSLRYKDSVILTLGYNTAIFNIILFIFRRKNIINMDGIEWKRRRWGFLVKAWFFLNEQLAKIFSSHMIADHPEIKKHLNKPNLFNKKITYIPYGADFINISPETDLLFKYGVTRNKYAILIARPVPENSILEIVRVFSNKRRNISLLILGNFSPTNPYHQLTLDSASDQIIFAGAVYDKKIVNALRFHALFYVHGHTVGGTNPALVEALGAGQAIIAHDNKFNRYVAKSAALYFDDEKSLDNIFDKLINNKKLINKLRMNAKRQFLDNYQWDTIFDQYEKLLLKYL